MSMDEPELNYFDAAEYLDTDEAISIFLADALETQNPSYIAHALCTVAKAIGMTEIAKESGISRELLCRSIGENANPTLETLLPILATLGVKQIPSLTNPT